MKKIVISSFVCLFFSVTIISQTPKHDRCWILGAGPSPGTIEPQLPYMNMLLEFDTNSETPKITSLPNSTGGFLREAEAISDKNGNLVLYSNGCTMKNWDDELVEDGHELNYPGEKYDYYCHDFGEIGYHSLQAALFLPVPGSETRYAYFHHRFDNTTSISTWVGSPTSFLVTETDMDAHGGKGEVIRKNQLIQKDTFVGLASAVRHANGRDWWITTPKNKSNQMIMALFGLDGQISVQYKTMPLSWAKNGSFIGSAISPDGNWYGRADQAGQGLQLFRFDRCSGEFTDPVLFDFDPPEPSGISAIGFSPNSRFLYLANAIELLQYDLTAENIESSKVLIGVWDRSWLPYPTAFSQMSLAPNGKLYLNTTDGTALLHTIHRPNEKGLACDFRQHDLQLPCYKGMCLPSFPNFGLGAVKGSPCDTIVLRELPCHELGSDDFATLTVAPNPAVSEVNITLPPCTTADTAGVENWRMDIYAVDGKRLWWRDNLKPKSKILIQVDTWAVGVYTAVLRRNSLRNAEVVRFMVMR